MSGRPPIDGYVDPNWPNPMGDGDAPIIIYGYTPSFALAVLGVVLFTIATFIHVFQVVKYRTWYFIPVSVGTAMEVVGYVFRNLSAKKNPYTVIYFVLQYFFIVVAPVFFSAAIYTILSVLIARIGRQYTPLSPKVILWIFITCDVIATIVQVAGAALIGVAQSNRKDPTTANHILLGGLAFQVFTFFVFIMLLSIFLWRARRHITNSSSAVDVDAAAGNGGGNVKPAFIVALAIGTAMIYLRTCFRLAETAEGLGESLSSREVFFGCLEFAPVVIAIYLFVIYHPGRYLARNRPARKASTDA